MKIVLNVGAVKGAFIAANRIASSNRQNLANRHILVDVVASKITASNDSVSIEQTIELKSVEGEGLFLIDSVKFSSILSSLDASVDVTLKIKEGHVVVTANRSNFKIHSLSVEEFVLPKKTALSGRFLIAHSVLKKALEKTVPFADSSSYKEAFRGVLLELGQDLNAVATNGHSLSHCRIEGLSVDASLEGSSVIVESAIANLISSIKSANISVELYKNLIVAKGDDVTLTGRLVDAKFPNYRKIIGLDDSYASETIDCDALSTSLSRVKPLLDGVSKKVYLDALDGGKTLVRVGEGGDVAEDELDMRLPIGDTVGMNISYLETILKTKDESTQIFANPSKQGAIHFRDVFEGGFSHQVLMPMIS